MKARREVSCQGRFFAARYPEYNNITCPSWIKTNQFVQSDEFEFVLTFPPLCFWTFQRPCKTETNIQQDDQVPYRLSKCAQFSFNPFIVSVTVKETNSDAVLYRAKITSIV